MPFVLGHAIPHRDLPVLSVHARTCIPLSDKPVSRVAAFCSSFASLYGPVTVSEDELIPSMTPNTISSGVRIQPELVESGRASTDLPKSRASTINSPRSNVTVTGVHGVRSRGNPDAAAPALLDGLEAMCLADFLESPHFARGIVAHLTERAA